MNNKAKFHLNYFTKNTGIGTSCGVLQMAPAKPDYLKCMFLLFMYEIYMINKKYVNEEK